MQRDRRVKVVEMIEKLRSMETELIDMYVDLKAEGEGVNALTIDEMANSVTRAVTFGKRFLIG